MDKPCNPTDAKVECRGGPYDGERVPDVGMFWRVMASVNLATGQSQPGSSGTYVQRSRVYQWEPDG